MKTVFSTPPPPILLALAAVVSLSVSSYGRQAAEPDSGQSAHRMEALRLSAHRSNHQTLTVNPISYVCCPYSYAYNIWALAMKPGPNATVVYGGTDNGNLNSPGKVFKYDPDTNVCRLYGDVSSEASIRSLVTSRGDSIYGGTGNTGHLFSFKPEDPFGGYNDFGIIVSGDSIVSALAIGSGHLDSSWVFGATSQANFLPPDPDNPNQNVGGGHLFVYEPDNHALENLGRPLGSQRNIPCLTTFDVAGPGNFGYVCGGTGPDSTYIFVDCGGYCHQAHPDTCGPVQSSGSVQRILGICRVSDDSIFAVTCDVPDTDSAMVFYYRWPYPDWNTWLRVGKLDEGEYRAGPMVVGRDGLIYFSSIYTTVQNSTPRFYQWNWRDPNWNPGPGDDENSNPRYWTHADIAHVIGRYRSFAADSSGLIYIGTGSELNTDTAYVLVFDPTVVSRDLGSGSPATAINDERAKLAVTVFPNPFTRKVLIAYTTVHSAASRRPHPSLAIYDMAGTRIRTFIAGQGHSTNGMVLWDGCNDSGSMVPSGTYFCRLTSGDVSCTKKLVFLK